MHRNRITELRQRNSISQDDLADALDLPVRVVRALEAQGHLAPPETLDFIETEITRWRAAAQIRLRGPERLEALRLMDEAEVGDA